MCAEANEIIFFNLKDDLFSLIYQICLGIGASSRHVKLLRYTENTQTRDDITIYGHRKLEQEEMRFCFLSQDVRKTNMPVSSLCESLIWDVSRHASL